MKWIRDFKEKGKTSKRVRVLQDSCRRAEANGSNTEFSVAQELGRERQHVGPLVGEWEKPLLGPGEYGIKGISSCGLVHLL